MRKTRSTAGRLMGALRKDLPLPQRLREGLRVVLEQPGMAEGAQAALFLDTEAGPRRVAETGSPPGDWSLEPALDEAAGLLAAALAWARQTQRQAASGVASLFAAQMVLWLRWQQSQEEVTFLAYHDPLTGLPNRRPLPRHRNSGGCLAYFTLSFAGKGSQTSKTPSFGSRGLY